MVYTQFFIHTHPLVNGNKEKQNELTRKKKVKHTQR